MVERISLKLERLLAGPRGEDGQGMTEYGVVIALVLVTLGAGLGLLGGAIETFLSEVVIAIENLT